MTPPRTVEGETCPNCFLGTLHLSTGRGRFLLYRGTRFELPADLILPTCVRCGMQPLSPETLREVTAAFDALLKARKDTP